MENIIVEKLREIKEGIFSEIVKKIEGIEKISTQFRHTNLKIHDVSYYIYQAVQSGIITDKQGQDAFNNICELEYENFKEWENQNLNYVFRSYIGRTSSFWYDSNWYGDIIDNGVLEELLEGKSLDYTDYLGGLKNRIYEYLVNDIEVTAEILEVYDINDYDDENEMKDDINEFFDTLIEYLEDLSSDLDAILEIVEEAKKAYDYLDEYKTEEYEYAIAKDYLEHDISEYYSDTKAGKLFEDIIAKIDKLNKVETLTIEHVVNEKQHYDLIVKINDKEHTIDTNVSTDHELSETAINSVMHFLNEKINENFELN